MQVAFFTIKKKGVEISLRKFDRRGILITQPPKLKKRLKNAVSSSVCKVKWSAKKSIDLLKREKYCSAQLGFDLKAHGRIQNDFARFI